MENAENIIRDVNPIDYYNIYQLNDAIDILLSNRNIKKVDIESFTYYKNTEDKNKKMIVIKNNNFLVKISSDLPLYVNQIYTPFMLMQKLKYKGNFRQALNYVNTKFLDLKESYIRVNVKYHKVIDKVDRYGIVRRELKLWDKQTITDDFGKDYLSSVNTYDDFVIVPDNKDYKEVVDNNYNLYSKFQHDTTIYDIKDTDKIKWTLILLQHVFGEQYELGLKYIKVLYDHPEQILPILVLVSEKRQTGKTTFIDWINILFGNNSVVINPKDIGNDFNASYADKNIIAIEESKFDSTQTIEKIKNLSTQKKIMVNTKFIQHYSLPFYGKIIITSNDENKFMIVDDPEIRYWVRKIGAIKFENHNVLNDLINEIPYFLFYLDSLDDVDLSRSRMVFTPEELVTDALSKVKSSSLPQLHKDLKILLDSFCEENDVKELYFSPIDIKDKFYKHNTRIDVSYIDDILKRSMKLEKQISIKYPPISAEPKYDIKKQGRPYKYKYDG